MKTTLRHLGRLLIIIALFSVRVSGINAQTVNLNQMGDSMKYYLDGVRVTFAEFDTLDPQTIDSFAIRSDKEGDTSIIVTTFHPKEMGSVIYIVNEIVVSKGIRDKIQADDIASDSVKKEDGRETHIITTKSGRVLKEQ